MGIGYFPDERCLKIPDLSVSETRVVKEYFESRPKKEIWILRHELEKLVEI